MARKRRSALSNTEDSSNRNDGEFPPSPEFHVVAIAASAGGLSALSHVLAPLPRTFPAAIVIVQHLDPNHRSLMSSILARRSEIDVREAKQGERLCPGQALIAPPNKHLLVEPDGTVSLSNAALVHFVRPSADLLFESVAASFRDKAIAVVLSGTGSDGTGGLAAIKEMGGTVIAQDEATSEFFGMPRAAIHSGYVDQILPLNDIPQELIKLMCDKSK